MRRVSVEPYLRGCALKPALGLVGVALATPAVLDSRTFRVSALVVNALLESRVMSNWARSFVGAAAMAPALAGADRYNLQLPPTLFAREIYDLHSLLLVICGVIFVVVFGAMIYSIIKHRQAAGRKAAQFHANVLVEIAWTIVPFLILVGMAYPATKTVISIQDTSRRDITVTATGVRHHPALAGDPCLAKPDIHQGMSMILSAPA